MFTLRLHVDVIIFSFFFSILFCGICVFMDNLLSFWIFLELCGMSIIPSFFYSSNSNLHGFYNSLLTYIIMSGLSSILLVSGIIFSSLYIFIFGGFAIKFGLFPFSLWMYRVFTNSNWYFIFLVSVVSKFPIIIFCFIFQFGGLGLIFLDCLLTILTCSLFFWLFSQSWEFIWCHISLSSVSTLVVACFSSSFEVCLGIYLYYAFWSVMCICYFNYLGNYENSNFMYWVYCFLLLVTPISLPLFYKLGVCFAILYSSIYVLLAWCVYSFSEQFFLYKVSSDYFYSGVYNSWI
uniref:NADH dehydrogenase subunit 2 n=1 Tax=Nippotaenia mogurndae TaxID=116902 RepID=UPI0021CCD845|nr:NADH dehydrogenase subunit 2 [Nippotaenia mogurndae]UWT58591.1 NADH dehydrogenase subunit 2 [Nippotaenia mogurndae]